MCLCAHVCVCTHACVCPQEELKMTLGTVSQEPFRFFFILLLYGVSFWPGTLQVAQAGFSSSGFKGKHYCSTLMWVLGSYSGPQTYTASTLFSPGVLKWTNLRQLRMFCLLWVPGRSPWGQRWWQQVFVGHHIYSHTLLSLFLPVILGVV